VPDTTNEQTDEQAKENEAGVEEDTNAETDQDQNPDGEQQEDSDSEGDENAEDGDEDSDDEGGDDLPEWARKKMTKANAEAANYRTKLREAEDKLKDAKTPEEVEEIVNQMTKDREAAETALLRENVALKFKLPEKLQKRLTGTTREEMEADAKELADLFGTDEDDEDVTLEGGLNPRNRDSDDPDDPRALAKKYGRRGKRR
jgi:hypothetical protein